MVDIIRILFFGFVISIVEINFFRPITINLINHRIPDLLLIYLIYVTNKYGRSKGIIIAFLFGLVQDIATQVNLLGVFSFSKSCFHILQKIKIILVLGPLTANKNLILSLVNNYSTQFYHILLLFNFSNYF